MGKLLYPQLQDKNWLYNEYVVMGKTMKRIADEVGTYACVVLDAIRKHGIQVRKPWQHIKGVPFNLTHRSRISSALKGRIRSEYKRNGNPNWRGGVSTENQILRGSPKSRGWRKSVIDRDIFCINCNSSDNLEAHHIKSWRDNPELRFDIWNGMTLCNSCHKKYHKSLRMQTGLTRRTSRPDNAEPAREIAQGSLMRA